MSLAESTAKTATAVPRISVGRKAAGMVSTDGFPLVLVRMT
jgi:hypothetical protein